MSGEKSDAYKVFYPLIRAGLDTRYHRMVDGTENIPDQPAVYAANHVQFADSPLIAASYTEATGKPLRFAAKQEYFDGKGIDDRGKFGRPVKWFMEHTHMIPVDRENTNPRAFQVFQETVTDRIRQGNSVALHPEGTRSEDGRLHKFKSGAARIALALSVPIVPVGLVYARYDNQRKAHVEIHFGKPIMPEEFHGLPYALIPGQGKKAEHLIQVVEDRVADLTGLEQDGVFAQLRKLRPGQK